MSLKKEVKTETGRWKLSLKMHEMYFPKLYVMSLNMQSPKITTWVECWSTCVTSHLQDDLHIKTIFTLSFGRVAAVSSLKWNFVAQSPPTCLLFLQEQSVRIRAVIWYAPGASASLVIGHNGSSPGAREWCLVLRFHLMTISVLRAALQCLFSWFVGRLLQIWSHIWNV